MDVGTGTNAAGVESSELHESTEGEYLVFGMAGCGCEVRTGRTNGSGRGASRSAGQRFPAALCDWLDRLAGIGPGPVFMVEGGHECDGLPIVSLDEKAVPAAGREIREAGSR